MAGFLIEWTNLSYHNWFHQQLYSINGFINYTIKLKNKTKIIEWNAIGTLKCLGKLQCLMVVE
jgi:hypothetical protein